MPQVKLPVDEVLPELAQWLEKNPALVLEATPGAGKTTRVPPAFLGAKFRGEREIIVLEPRRLAAKMAAIRVADELGEKIGQTVGYHFRFERVGGPKTKIWFLTEGMFVRRLLGDPGLKNIAAVVVDEFHERHLHGDVAAAALRNLQLSSRPDLRVVVMSATLDTDRIAEYLGGAQILRVQTRRFDVAIEYMPLAELALDQKVALAVKRALQAPRDEAGDVLVFLPGIQDIRRAESALKDLARTHDFLITTLYGDLSRDEQDRAIAKASKTKIILSTNVAETSLTIEGVKTVIDSGLARIASYSYWSGLPSLKTRPVSRASCIQRAGRAGRTAPGRCIRLYTKESFDTRPQFETPELLRADLSQTILELGLLGVSDPKKFPWFEAPQSSFLESAHRILYRLGAIEKNGELTALGKRMAEIPTHPRLSRLVLEGEKMGIAHEAATLAAMLAEGQSTGFAPGAGFHLDLLSALERFEPVGSVLRAREQFVRATKAGPVQKGADLRKAVLASFPDRVAKVRALGAGVSRNTSGNKTELILGSGGAVTVENSSLLSSGHEFFVAVDIEERERGAKVCRSLCSIEPDWLFDLSPEGVTEKSDVVWDEQRSRVSASTRMVYDGLTLMESVGEGDPSVLAEVLAQNALARGIGMFCDEVKLKNFLTRVKFVRDKLPAPELPELDENGIKDLLKQACLGKTSFAELKESDLFERILECLTQDQRYKVDKFAPESIQLTGGRKVKVNYEQDKSPWIESRLQDFFGMKTGPTVLGGRVPLTLHLLAPNHRAVQVTSDLVGFWTRNYPDLRKELGRRYPRHAWPENPLVIPPPRSRPQT